MAFTAEDGTGLADANSYATADYADTYFADRGIVAWTGLDAAKEAALITATDYVDLVFAKRWVGEPLTTTQALSWPREPVEGADAFTFRVDPDDGLPVGLKRAVSEYALRALGGVSLAPDPVVDDSGFSIITTRKAVGPIEKEFRAVGSQGSPRTLRPYPTADMQLQPLLLVGTGGGRVTR